MHNYTPADEFTPLVPILDDSDLILPAAGTIDTSFETLADRTQWLKNRTGNSRVVGLYGNAIGAIGYSNIWSNTTITALDPVFGELASTEGLIAFGSPVALASGDVLLVRCDVNVNLELVVGTPTQIGIALGMSLSGGAYTVLPMSARYIAAISASPVSLSALVAGDVASSFNFNIMASITGSSTTSEQIALRGAGVITALHLTVN